MRRERFDFVALVDHRLHRAELVERVQIFAHGVFRIAVFFGKDARGRLNDARYRRILRQPLLLHEQFERAVAPAAGGDFEQAGIRAIVTDVWPHIEALQQGAAGDVIGKLADRHPGLHAPDIGLGQDQPVERNVARRAEDDLLLCSGHGHSP